MSQKVTVDVISDVSGETGAHTVEFSWGESFPLEIDLTEAERTAVQSFLQPYMDKARKVAGKAIKRGPGRPRRSASPATAVAGTSGGTGLTKEQRTEVREFCAAAGKPLNSRGRLPEVAITAWQQGKPEIWLAVA